MIEQYFVHVSFLKIGKKELWELRSLEQRVFEKDNKDEETIQQIISDAEKKVYNKDLERFELKEKHSIYRISNMDYDYIHNNNLSLFDQKILLEHGECSVGTVS